MIGKDLAIELEKEEQEKKALILKAQIKGNEQELNHLLNKELSISKSLSKIKTEINSVRQKKAHLLKKDVDDVELPIWERIDMGHFRVPPSIIGVHGRNLPCRCVTLPMGSIEFGKVVRSRHFEGEQLYRAGENINAGDIVGYDRQGFLVKAIGK